MHTMHKETDFKNYGEVLFFKDFSKYLICKSIPLIFDALAIFSLSTKNRDLGLVSGAYFQYTFL